MGTNDWRKMLHRLGILMLEENLSVREVSELSGISEETIRKILDVNRKVSKIRWETAMIIAGALYVKVHSLFSSDELTDDGGRPLMGATRTLRRGTHGQVCRRCFVEIPLANGDNCPDCGVTATTA